MFIQCFFVSVLLLIVQGQDCVDDHDAALPLIMPIVELGALRFFGVDPHCVLAVAAIPGLCEMETNPCCVTCQDYAEADFHERIMVNKRYLHIDSLFGGILSSSSVETFNAWYETTGQFMVPEELEWESHGVIDRVTGSRNWTEFFLNLSPWVGPEAYYDLTAVGACTSTPILPSGSVIVENSPLILKSQTPSFLVRYADENIEPECYENLLTYEYADKDAVQFIKGFAYPIDKSIQRNWADSWGTNEELCDLIMQSCTGDNKQYDDVDDCVQYHSSMQRNADIPDTDGCSYVQGHTVDCHWYHLAWPRAGFRPEYYCPRLGKDGANADMYGIQYCTFESCTPDKYYLQCYNSFDFNLATLKWTQTAVDYTGQRAEAVANLRRGAQAGDPLSETAAAKVRERMDMLMPALQAGLVECTYDDSF